MATDTGDIGKMEANKKLTAQSCNLYYGLALHDMSSSRFNESMKKLEKLRDREIAKNKGEKHQLQRDKMLANVEKDFYSKTSVFPTRQNQEPDFLTTPNYERHTVIGSRRELRSLQQDATRRNEEIIKRRKPYTDQTSTDTTLKVTKSTSAASISTSACKIKEEKDKLDNRMNQFLTSTDKWFHPNYPPTVDSPGASNLEFKPLPSLNGLNINVTGTCDPDDKRVKPIVPTTEPKPKTAAEFKHGLSQARDEASKFVMTDLMNRSRGVESSEQRGREAQLKRETAAMLKMKRQALKNKRRQAANAAKSTPDKLSNDPDGKRAQTKAEQIEQLQAELENTEEVLELADEFVTVGLKAEVKLKILKEYINTKRWHPSERDTMTKLRRLIEHWTRVSKQVRETPNRQEVYCWTDDEEKNFFIKLIQQLRERRMQLEYDPWKILHTAYLRIDKDAVRVLENLCREMGKDPGIHVHADDVDFYNTNIFGTSSNDKITAVSAKDSSERLQTRINRRMSMLSDRVNRPPRREPIRPSPSRRQA